jgi:hypothetical protein
MKLKRYEVTVLMVHQDDIDKELTKKQDEGWEIGGDIKITGLDAFCIGHVFHIPLKREEEKQMLTEEEEDKLAEEYADSVDRRGCSYWNGMYRGYKRALEDIRSRMTEDEKEVKDKSISIDQYMRLNPDIETGGDK